MRKLAMGLCGLAILLGGAGCARRQPRVLRVAVQASPAYWKATADLWAKLTSDRTNGRVLIESVATRRANVPFQLKDVREGWEADCAFIPAPALAEEDRAFNVFALAWLFPDADTAGRVCEGPMGEAMLKRLDKLGLVGLAYGSSGFWQLATRSAAVRRPSDLRGLTIALPPGYAPQADTLRALGARPVQGSGEADGWEWSVAAPPAGSGKAPRAITLWDAAYEPFVVVANRRAWERLPEFDRGLVQMSAQDAVETQRRLAAEAERRFAHDLEARGVTVVRLRLAERAAFERAAAPAIRRWTQAVGPELVRRFRAEVERAR